jgi:DNA ligase D-like protein (predicted 3'-phosphoesterase)
MPDTDALREYSEKRRFDQTAEPEPEVEDTGLHRFVVQEHHASRLHWDFRLEMDGVLKSWAVPKGPPEVSNVRRLAVQTEDHPIAYIDFEGEIAEGQYGAGSVRIWDQGTYDLEERDEKKLVFVLRGGRLSGGYVLVNTNEDNWLMLKRK